MQDLRYYKVMADYNHWMNIKLYSVCSDIPDDLRRKDVGGFRASLHAGLDYLLAADQLWLARFEGRELSPLPDPKQPLIEDFGKLRRTRETTDQAIQDWVNELSVDWLKQPFTYTDTDGQSRTLPGWIMAVNLFNLQIHHRGQIATLLHQLGYAYGETDLPWLPSLQALD